MGFDTDLQIVPCPKISQERYYRRKPEPWAQKIQYFEFEDDGIKYAFCCIINLD